MHKKYGKDLVKFGCTIFELYQQTDKHRDAQTDKQSNRHTHHNTLQRYWGDVKLHILHIHAT